MIDIRNLVDTHSISLMEDSIQDLMILINPVVNSINPIGLIQKVTTRKRNLIHLKTIIGHSSFKGGERHSSYRGKSSFGGDKKPSYRGGHFDKARQDKPQGATKKRTFHTGRKNFNRGR